MNDRKRLIGIVVAFIVAFIAWIITEDTVLSFLIGLVTEVITLLIELQMEIAETKEALLEKVKLAEAVESYSSIRKLVSDFNTVIQRANAKDIVSEIFTAEAKDIIREASETMVSLKQGRMRVRGHMAPYIKGAIRMQSLKEGGIATAIINSPNDWSGREMQHFHQVNVNLAKQGKKITRIFIVKDKKFLEIDSQIVTVMKEQHDAGISVRYVLFEELDAKLIRDIGFWDDKLVVNITFYPGIGAYDEATYETSPKIVKETREYFERMLILSHPISDILNQKYSSC